MEDLARNNRSFTISTIIMLVVAAIIVGVAMLFFPLTAYDDPNAGIIPGLINTPAGNALVVGFFALLAGNIAFYLNTIIRLERERADILERATATREAPQLPRKNPKALNGDNKA